MVQFCCIVGCGNRSNRDRKGFYRLPNVPKRCDKTSYKADIILRRRKQWLLNIKRADLKDGDAAFSPGYIRVCSDHFISGKPSSWSDIENIDWAPTVRMNYPKGRRGRVRLRSKKDGDEDFDKRNKKRKQKKSTELNRARRLKEFQRLTKRLTRSSDSSVGLIKEEPTVVDSERLVKEKLTVNPLIHRITVDCIVDKSVSPINEEKAIPLKEEDIKAENNVSLTNEEKTQKIELLVSEMQKIEMLEETDVHSAEQL